MLVPPLELESNVSLWLSAVSQYKARVTFCSYSVMELCTRGLGAQTSVLRVRPYGRPPPLPVPQECAPVGTAEPTNSTQAVATENPVQGRAPRAPAPPAPPGREPLPPVPAWL